LVPLPRKNLPEAAALPILKPVATFKVPVKSATELMVWELIRPEVIAPVFSEVERRFVDDAVVAKKFVVVAEVPVAFTKVKFWRVVEPAR